MTEEHARLGRPPHRPTPRTRAIVVKRVAARVSQAHIAKELKITIPTLTLHYEEELQNGKALFLSQQMDRLDKQAGKGNVSAIKALIALAASVPDGSAEPKSPKAAALGKKEIAQARAEQANTGRFATPPPPGAAKTVQ